jgi:transcription antitermination factor NusG
MPYMVIVSTYGTERDARRDVRARGFTCYQPTFREMFVRRGRKVWEERLLFGRYFFARWDGASSWRGLFDLRTVAGIMMRSDEPLPALVRDWEIESIRLREDRSGHVTGQAQNAFHINQRVRAAVGVLAGNDGVYVGTGRGGCEIALLDLFGRQTKIEFAPGVLRAA